MNVKLFKNSSWCNAFTEIELGEMSTVCANVKLSVVSRVCSNVLQVRDLFTVTVQGLDGEIGSDLAFLSVHAVCHLHT